MGSSAGVRLVLVTVRSKVVVSGSVPSEAVMVTEVTPASV
jgi:hypothetical protein